VVAFAGLTEEDRFDATAGTKRFFDEADAFDADGAGFRGKTAAERHAEFFEPAIVAAGEDSGRGCARCGASGFAGGSHQGERSKFRAGEVNGPWLKRLASTIRVGVRDWAFYVCSADEAKEAAFCESRETCRARMSASNSNERRRAE